MTKSNGSQHKIERADKVGDQPWTFDELHNMLSASASALDMTTDQVRVAILDGRLPDTPAAFDARTALFLLGQET